MSRILDRNSALADMLRDLVPERTTGHLSAGALCYTPDDLASEMLLVVQGRVSLSLREPEGRALHLRAIEASQVFGHSAVTGDDCYDTFATAAVPTTVIRMPAAAVRAAALRDAGLALALLQDIGQHRITVGLKLEEVAFKSVPARLASLLLDMAQTHGGTVAQVLPRLSHRQLAEMINAYRETVTKVINQFRDARLLEIDASTIRLVNMHRLEELAQG